MGKHLYLMRHAETLFNLQGKTQGWCDSPLTERGREQARIAGRGLARRGVTFDHALCSTAERASDTLELAMGELPQGQLPYERLKDLREVGFGAYKGKDSYLEPTGDLRETYFVPFGGERPSEVGARMERALTATMERDECQSVLVVSHAGAMLNFYRRWLALFEVDCQTFCNCQTFHYRFEEGRFVCVEIIDPTSPHSSRRACLRRRAVRAGHSGPTSLASRRMHGRKRRQGGVITRCANAQRGARPWVSLTDSGRRHPHGPRPWVSPHGRGRCSRPSRAGSSSWRT